MGSGGGADTSLCYTVVGVAMARAQDGVVLADLFTLTVPTNRSAGLPETTLCPGIPPVNP